MKQLTTTRSIPQLSIQRNPGWIAWLKGKLQPMSYEDKLSQSLVHGYNSVRW